MSQNFGIQDPQTPGMPGLDFQLGLSFSSPFIQHPDSLGDLRGCLADRRWLLRRRRLVALKAEKRGWLVKLLQCCCTAVG